MEWESCVLYERRKHSFTKKVDNHHHDTCYLQLGGLGFVEPANTKKTWLCWITFVVHPSVLCCLCTKLCVFNEQICLVLFLLERLFGSACVDVCMYACVYVCVCVCWLNRLSHIFLLSSVAMFSSLWWLQLSWGPRSIFTLWKGEKKQDLMQYMQCRSQCAVLHNRLGCSFADTAFETSPMKGSQK